MAISDKAQAAQGKTVQVGLDQLNNPTPQWARITFRAILYLSAIWAITAPVVTEIPENVLMSINKYLLLGNAIINVTIKFFGWDFKQ